LSAKPEIEPETFALLPASTSIAIVALIPASNWISW
jgi:hypothetical protein